MQKNYYNKRATDNQKATIDKWENMGHLVMDKLDRFENQFEKIINGIDNLTKSVNKKLNEHDIAITKINVKLWIIGIVGTALFTGSVALVYNILEKMIAKQMGI